MRLFIHTCMYTCAFVGGGGICEDVHISRCMHTCVCVHLMYVTVCMCDMSVGTCLCIFSYLQVCTCMCICGGGGGICEDVHISRCMHTCIHTCTYGYEHCNFAIIVVFFISVRGGQRELGGGGG